MKNLNKKISSVVLASMVLFGGIAASSVQSFAAFGKASLINVAQRNPEQDWKKIDDYFISIHKNYKVDDSAGSRSEALAKAKKLYSDVKKYQKIILKLNDKNFERRLKMLSSEFDAFVVEYHGMWYLISNKNFGKSSVKEESSSKVKVKKEEQKQEVEKPVVKKEESIKSSNNKSSGYSGSQSLINVAQKNPVEDWEKIDAFIKKSGYKHKVYKSYGSRWEASAAAKVRYSNVRRYQKSILKLNDKNFERRLQMLLRGYDAFVVEYHGMWYLIDNLSK